MNLMWNMKKKKLRITQSFFGPRNWNPLIGMGNDDQVCGHKLSPGWDMLSLNCLLDKRRCKIEIYKYISWHSEKSSSMRCKLLESRSETAFKDTGEVT